MKKKMLTWTLILMFVSVPPLFSQQLGAAPPPPNPANTGNASGGGAPIGGGLFILLGLGAAYAGKKIYQYNKMQSSEE